MWLSLLFSLSAVIQNDGFVVNPVKTVTNGVPVVFVDITEKPDNLERVWDFGDGKTDNGKVVKHLYDREGVYTVKMKIGPDEYVRPDYVQVFGLPEPEIRKSSSFAKPGEELSFTAKYPDIPENVEVVSTVWYFGKIGISNGTEVTQKFPVTGDYDVSLQTTYKIEIGSTVPLYRQQNIDVGKISVTGIFILVDGSSVSPLTDQNGSSWETAFSDLQSALYFAESRKIPFVCVSESPLVIEGIRQEAGLVIPANVHVYGGHKTDTLPQDVYSGSRTILTYATPDSRNTVMKDLVRVESNASFVGFNVDIINTRMNSINGVGVRGVEMAAVRDVGFTPVTNQGSTRPSYGILIQDSKRIGVENIFVSGFRGIKNSELIRCEASSDVQFTNLVLEDNDLSETPSSGLLGLINTEQFRILNSKFRNNSLSKNDPGVVRIVTDKGKSVIGASLIQDTDFHRNEAGRGAGVFVEKKNTGGISLVLSKCSFRENNVSGSQALGAGVFQSGGDLVAENCVFYGNLASSGNALYFSGDKLRVTHCTIANVGPSEPIADLFFAAKGARIENSILYSKGTRLISTSSAATLPTIFSCITYPEFIQGSRDTRVVDPLFLGEHAYDFRLSNKSPAIDAAEHDTDYFSYLDSIPSWRFSSGSYDIRGVSRVVGKYDIGAYEWTPDPPQHYLDSLMIGTSYPPELARIMKEFYTKFPEKLPDPKILEMIDASLKLRE